MRRKIQKQNWCPATRLLEFKITIFMFDFLITSHFSMQCTNISCYSKCKAYYVNHITSFFISWAFVSPCPFFPSTSHYKYWHFSFPALSTVTFLSCFLPPIYTALPALFTQTHLPAIHPNTLWASLPYSHLHAPICSQKSPHHIFFPLHIRQTWLNFLHVKKSNRATVTGAALFQELSFQQPIPNINTRRILFLFWYPSILELFQYLIIFFQLLRGHLRRHFISILKYFTILHYD